MFSRVASPVSIPINSAGEFVGILDTIIKLIIIVKYNLNKSYSLSRRYKVLLKNTNILFWNTIYLICILRKHLPHFSKIQQFSLQLFNISYLILFRTVLKDHRRATHFLIFMPFQILSQWFDYLGKIQEFLFIIYINSLLI